MSKLFLHLQSLQFGFDNMLTTAGNKFFNIFFNYPFLPILPLNPIHIHFNSKHTQFFKIQLIAQSLLRDETVCY